MTRGNRKTSLLVFDFDGVLSNSIHDSFMTSLNAYLAVRPGHCLPADGPLEPVAPVFAFEAAHPELFGPFSRLIPLGNRAEQYYAIWRLIETGRSGRIRSQEDFDVFSASLPEKERAEYDERFYALRRRGQDRNPDLWADLLPAFDGIPETVRSLSERFTLAIATAKDMRSVRLLLDKYGLRGCFEERFILDKDVSHSKTDHLARLHAMLNMPFSDMHFIDDKVLHLRAAKPLGVRGYLALWGFNTEREHAEAEREGFVLLTLEGLARLTPD
jgi:phosphoglycolate phosphatase-like HAD superfamily hydrolase